MSEDDGRRNPHEESVDIENLRDRMVKFWRDYQAETTDDVNQDLTFVPNSVVLLDLLLKKLERQEERIKALDAVAKANGTAKDRPPCRTGGGKGGPPPVMREVGDEDGQNETERD
jgi:hypothetical protein